MAVAITPSPLEAKRKLTPEELLELLGVTASPVEPEPTPTPTPGPVSANPLSELARGQFGDEGVRILNAILRTEG